MIEKDEGAFLLVNKPIGWTSFDVVNKLRYLLKIKKIGHAGTLDPLATGLLIICSGKMTKRIDELALHLKKNAKDNHSRRGLLQMVANRKSHMKYLEKKNPRRYNSLVKKIGLKK